VIVVAEHGVATERRGNRRDPAREVARVLGAKTDEVATEEQDVRIEPRQLLERVVDGLRRSARTGVEVRRELDAQRVRGAERGPRKNFVSLDGDVN
jgi:hypothetical protein